MLSIGMVQRHTTAQTPQAVKMPLKWTNHGVPQKFNQIPFRTYLLDLSIYSEQVQACLNINIKKSRIYHESYYLHYIILYMSIV